MQKKHDFDSNHLMYCAEKLMQNASNRYRITVQVANRAKRRRYEDYDNFDDPLMKPTIRAVIEMSDEIDQEDILPE